MTGSKKIELVLVDDHPIVRKGLRELLSIEPDFKVLGDFSTFLETTSFLEHRSNSPDVCIVDLSLPERSGFDLIEVIRKNHPLTKILVLSMHEENLYAARVVDLGASGYLMKSQPPATVVDAVRSVHEGQLWLSPEVQQQMLQSPRSGGAHSEPQDISHLSNRELQVLSLISLGLKPKQIAIKMGLSTKTINVYKEKLKDKLSLESSTQLLQYASSLRGSISIF